MELANKWDLAAQATQRRYVEFDVVGYGRLRIQSLTEAERAAVEYALAYAEGDDERAVAMSFKSRLIAASVVDDEGERYYLDSEHDQIQTYDSRLVAAIYEQIDKLNGVAALQQDAEKNSAAANGKPLTELPLELDV